MSSFPTLVVPSFDVFSSDWLSQINEEAILAQEEAEYEEKLNEVRNANSNLIPIGKTTPENDQEDYEPDAEDDDADNAEEESEVEEVVTELPDVSRGGGFGFKPEPGFLIRD